MAEIVASVLLQVIFQKLASEAVNKVVRAQGIHSELNKLNRTLSQIQALLNDASQKEITDESVKLWLNSLQHLAYDIDDILDDLATDAMHHDFTKESGSVTSKVRKLVPTCCTGFALDNRMRHKLDNITQELQDLLEEKASLGLIVKDERPKSINRRLQTSIVHEPSIVGRRGEKEALLPRLFLVENEPRNQNFSIVPIVGIGGVGKTTLARLLYNEKQVTDHFELKAWVCVSEEFDCFNISKVIFQSVTGENKDFADLNLLQVALRDQLSGKRFLLVLDDVWSESYEDWDTLMGPFHSCATGSKIIITTRKEQLLKKLGYDQLNYLQSLSHDDALSLFAQHALGEDNFYSHSTLKPHGEGIVKKCAGLPLALIALGRLLRTKKDEEEYWKEVLNSEIWRLQDGGGIVPALRLSYHDLSAHLKHLFAYCSLFPKDYLFDKDELVLLWMAEGFLPQSSLSMSSQERLGREYFDELFSRSFFQKAPNVESQFVMHDLMNDLATSVAEEFFLRLDNETEKHITNKYLEKYRHMSFVCERYIISKKFKPFEKAKNLRTFLAASVYQEKSWQRFYFSNKILVDLLPELPMLRVLSLSNLVISEVPESVGNLRHLRFLNLSRTKITHLPENVCNLYNLQTLIVFGCHNLIKLPNSFIKLKNLRHFDIRDTPLLNKMPLGIGELKSLQTLSKIIINDENGFEIKELKGLKNLCGKISIVGLDKVKILIHLREANFSQKIFTELEVEWSDVFDGSRNEMLEKEVLKELKPRNDNLKQVKIVSYGGIELPNWIGDPSFVRLGHVSILGCKKCTSLPPLGQLPSLKELFIKGLDEVKVMGLELFGTALAFPSLKILSIKRMPGLEEWLTNRGVVFPCLEKLSIKGCPNLVVITLEALPSIRVMKISACRSGVLRRLVHVASSIRKLKIESISGLSDEVWGGVIQYLGGVEEFWIDNCNEIRYLWQSEANASMVLMNLRDLKVFNCNKVVSLGDKEEEEDNRLSNRITSLRMLSIYSCESMECCTCPNSIETLSIVNCISVTSISFPKGGRQKLKSLVIFRCDKLLENELGGDTSSALINTKNMTTLEDVSISFWQNLKSITELSYFVHLVSLRIQDCESLDSFPDLQLTHLTSLTYLKIVNCPSMNASFPCGIWPPRLQVLIIGRLNKPVSKWGPQNFPTSLVDLVLHGGELLDDNVTDFSQLSDLFPSSLTYLRINGFKKLESISRELQHLTSLQHLDICYCPKIMHLPEMLLQSLLSLTIVECPKLQERRAYYWPLVSHIPHVDIDCI